MTLFIMLMLFQYLLLILHSIYCTFSTMLHPGFTMSGSNKADHVTQFTLGSLQLGHFSCTAALFMMFVQQLSQKYII